MLFRSEQPPKLFGETSYIFSKLLKENQLSNFKSGLICSAQRNDTIFTVFYNSSHNNIICIYLGRLQDTLSRDCYGSSYENEIFRKLRYPSGLLCSKYATGFKVKNENISMFSQTLTQHVTVGKNDDRNLTTKIRTIFYSDKRGVYNIEYSNEYVEDNLDFQWPYIEGDFIF